MAIRALAYASRSDSGFARSPLPSRGDACVCNCVVNGVFERATMGTPQGGVVSPLLANIVLHSLDKWFDERGVPFVRYADDWVAFIRNTDRADAESFKSGIAAHLRASCGLELSPEKTHITDVCDGFHFLGFRLQGVADPSGGITVRIGIAQKSIRNFREKIAAAITDQHKPVHSRIMHANSIIRGWAQAVRIANDYPAIAADLDTFIASLEKRARLDEHTLVKLAGFRIKTDTEFVSAPRSVTTTIRSTTITNERACT